MPNENNVIKMFEDKNIRVKWNYDEEKWYFGIVDIVSILTDGEYQTARKYWNKLKQRLKKT